MPNISDRELDKLFQDAGQELRPEFDPKDWEDMAKRLEKTERRAMLKRAGGYGLGVLLLISSVAWLPESSTTIPQQRHTYTLTLPAETATTTQPETASPADATTTLSENTTVTTPVPSLTGTGKSSLSTSASANVDHNNASATADDNTKQPATTTPHKASVKGNTPSGRNTAAGTGNLRTKTPRSTQRDQAIQNALTINHTHTNTKHKPAEYLALYKEFRTASTTQASDTPKEIAATNTVAKPEDATSRQLLRTDSKTATTPSIVTIIETPNGVTPTATSTEKTEAQTDRAKAANQASSGHESLNNEQTRNAITLRKDNVSKISAAENTETTNDPANAAQQPTDSVAATTQRNVASVNDNDIVNTQPSTADNIKASAVTDNAQETTAGTTTLNESTHHADSTITPLQDSVALANTEAKTDSTAQPPEEKKAPYRAKWFIKLPISPDYSAINYGKTDKTGINVGLMTEFMPTKHWSVSAGAIWSKKIYTWDSPDKTYGGNGGYGYSGYGPTKASFLSGDCRMIDIPLNITYYLRPEARTNFFISTGLSSYIMLLEMYTYTVEANQQEYTYDEKYVRKNKNWFSMLNLSIGIQHRLSSRFQIQAEPFLKAPVSGIGQGKVNLNTMGAFFTLKLQLNN